MQPWSVILMWVIRSTAARTRSTPARVRVGNSGNVTVYHVERLSFNASRNRSSTVSGLMTFRHTLSVQGVLRWLAALTQGEQARPA